MIDHLFDYLSDVRNLPRSFTAMTSAEPAGVGVGVVRVMADLHGVTKRTAHPNQVPMLTPRR